MSTRNQRRRSQKRRNLWRAWKRGWRPFSVPGPVASDSQFEVLERLEASHSVVIFTGINEHGERVRETVTIYDPRGFDLVLQVYGLQRPDHNFYFVRSVKMEILCTDPQNCGKDGLYHCGCRSNPDEENDQQITISMKKHEDF